MSQQLEFFSIPSPCRGICEVDKSGFCKGCFRSRPERFNWLQMSDAEKRNILRLCRQRALRKQRLLSIEETRQVSMQPDLFDE